MSGAPPRAGRDSLRVAIVGAGIAGLATAWRLLSDPELAAPTPTAPADGPLQPALPGLRSRLHVTLLEAAGRPGGNIRALHDGGFLVEWGPNGFLDNAPETPRLAARLGIEERLLPARDAAARRFIYVRGALRPLPLSPAAFLASGILSLRGRLRVLREPFIPPRPDPDESVFSFAARRIGDEAARILVDAMVSGVYGGDSRDLALASAFPKMHALERDHGGLVRGMIARKREARRHDGRTVAPARRPSGGPAGPGGVLTSFDRGFEVLTDVLAAELARSGAADLRYHAPAKAIVPVEALTGAPGGPGEETPDGRSRVAAGPSGGTPRCWRIELAGGESIEADAVLLAIPARAAAPLVQGFDGRLAALLGQIPEAPLVVVGAGYRSADFVPPLDGFGFLVPRGPGPRALGVLWDSCIYPNRAPAGRVLLRAMLGGAHDPAAIELTDEEALAQVRRDLEMTMGLTARPDPVWILRHPQGIPQYTLGHPGRLAAIEERLTSWSGLHLAGNAYHGISVNHCVERSIPVARAILHALA